MNRRAPRLLIVAHRLDIGGTELHLSRILPALQNAGHEICVFVISRGGRLESDFQNRGIEIIGPDPGGGALVQRWQAFTRLRSCIGRWKPDVLHAFLSEPYLIMRFAMAGLSGPITVMSRRSLSNYQKRHTVIGRIERHLHGTTDVLLGNSSAVLDDLYRECADRKKIGCIPNGIELPSLPTQRSRAAARMELGLPEDSLVIMSVGNLLAYKGHDDLIAALGLIASRLPQPWRLVLVGRDHNRSARLLEQAAALGISRNVQWIGERRDAQDLLDAADIGVLPSHEEGFSNVLLEKMGKGLAVIATSAGGNVDAVVDGETGALVPIKSPERLGQAIIELAGNEDMRRHLGMAARRRVAMHFSLDRCIDRYRSLYAGLLDRRPESVQQIIDGSFKLHLFETGGAGQSSPLLEG